MARRTQTAVELLNTWRGRKILLTEVSASSGFGSPCEMRSAFRSVYGMLPSEYLGAGALRKGNSELLEFATVNVR